MLSITITHSQLTRKLNRERLGNCALQHKLVESKNASRSNHLEFSASPYKLGLLCLLKLTALSISFIVFFLKLNKSASWLQQNQPIFQVSPGIVWSPTKHRKTPKLLPFYHFFFLGTRNFRGFFYGFYQLVVVEIPIFFYGKVMVFSFLLIFSTMPHHMSASKLELCRL